MFNISEKVSTTREIRAGLGEDGPKVCEKGSTGVVIKIEKHEPDGVQVRLSNGVEWWFKPNQLEKIDG